MQNRTFSLARPDIDLKLPQANGKPDIIERQTIPELILKIPNGAFYLKTGDVRIDSYSSGGGRFAFELDENITAYLVHGLDHPRAAAVLDALSLIDAQQARDSLLSMFTEAEEKAAVARQNADPFIVTLTEPAQFHGSTVEHVKLSEPTGRLFNKLGRPYTWTKMPGNTFHPVERLDIVRQYIEASIQHELGADLLRLVKLVDAMQIKAAVLDFFTATASIVVKKSTLSSSDGSVSATATPPA